LHCCFYINIEPRALLDWQWQIVGLEQRQDADVGGGVAEPGDRGLDQGGTETAVKSDQAALLPQRSRIDEKIFCSVSEVAFSQAWYPDGKFYARSQSYDF
jgi:hypothetical protein